MLTNDPTESVEIEELVEHRMESDSMRRRLYIYV